jgi:two-component system, chemotaxis family, CheB/CheR fusion protein
LTTLHRMSKRKTDLPPKSFQDFPVVGIGASAGGLDAFKTFLSGISLNSNMAYVLVQHLAPKHQSILPEILVKSTKLPVYEISDDINLAPNTIYIIPENKILISVNGHLKLEPRDLTVRQNMPINIFFKSLAETHKSFAVGIILTGLGSDGTEGIKSIKEYGGITYAQIPYTADSGSMPQSAVDSGAVDFVLPVEEIPQHLIHINNAYLQNNAYLEDHVHAYGGDVLLEILDVLKTRTGNDLKHYKQPTLRRRIARRMVITDSETTADYLLFLQKNIKEQDVLFNDVLIPVSYFFREPMTFEVILNQVLPLIIKDKSSDEGIRFWIAGCSTGEEAYSMAICLHEFLSEKSPDTKVQIFASDISEQVISKARAGQYLKQSLLNVSEVRLQKFFVKTEDVYQISKTIRDMCVFAVHNLLADPPFAKMDLVSCRNVLIYFDPFLQKKAINTFHYALRPKGFLILGKSETPTSSSNLFEPWVKNHKIFMRKLKLGRSSTGFLEQKEKKTIPEKDFPVLKSGKKDTDYLKMASAVLFNQYSPASVIVNENKDIVHFHGDTGLFLGHLTGKSSFNLFKMAKKGLSFELRNAFLKNSDTKNLQKSGILGEDNSYTMGFKIHALEPSPEPHYLITFNMTPLVLRSDTNPTSAQIDQERIKVLEEELHRLREDVRVFTEEHDSINEELQSANEELLSNSEELQSLNEELETSSEELQSNNEELISLNEEQLVAARMHAEAIVETVGVPLFILDENLRVKTANTAFYKFFCTSEKNTLGREIHELGTGQWQNLELRHLLQKILPNGYVLKDYELHGDFPEIGKKSLLLNARQLENDRYSEELILMAVDDITELKLSKLLRASEEKFRILANTAPVLMWVADLSGGFVFLNQKWLDYTGNTMQAEMGLGWMDNILADDLKAAKDTFTKKLKIKKEFEMQFRFKRHDGEFRWLSMRAVPRIDLEGDYLGFVGGCIDIQDQKNLEAKLEETVAKRTLELNASRSFLHSILDMTQNLIYIYDFDQQKITFINSKSLEITGFSKKNIEAEEKDIFNPLIHVDDRKILEKQRTLINQSKDSEFFETVFRIQNHATRKWTTQMVKELVFARNIKGEVTQCLGVAADITLIKKTNEMLLSKNKELKQSNQELASFSSIASHDLKEPLRKIMIFSKLLLEKEKDVVSEDSSKHLERIVVSAFRMQQLIEDLLNYSRMSSQKVRFIKTDLNKLLSEVEEDLKELIEDHKVELRIDSMPIIDVIPSQFRQLFFNLINNAIKYSKSGVTPSIRVSSEELASKDMKPQAGNIKSNYFKFTVSDNGIGFSENHKNKIFEPFQRLHGKDEYSGTGIGLAICQKIMDNHKGHIDAGSKEGIGSKFYIYVPQKQ